MVTKNTWMLRCYIVTKAVSLGYDKRMDGTEMPPSDDGDSKKADGM